MLEIGQLGCVSYELVCGVFYCVESGKAPISEDDSQERELRVELHKLVVETSPGRFWNFFLLIYVHSNYFMRFMRLFIERLI
jgi:hypothetical protein